MALVAYYLKRIGKEMQPQEQEGLKKQKAKKQNRNVPLKNK